MHGSVGWRLDWMSGMNGWMAEAVCGLSLTIINWYSVHIKVSCSRKMRCTMYLRNLKFMLMSLYIKEDKKLKQHCKSRDCPTFNQVFMGLRKSEGSIVWHGAVLCLYSVPRLLVWMGYVASIFRQWKYQLSTVGFKPPENNRTSIKFRTCLDHLHCSKICQRDLFPRMSQQDVSSVLQITFKGEIPAVSNCQRDWQSSSTNSSNSWWQDALTIHQRLQGSYLDTT